MTRSVLLFYSGINDLRFPLLKSQLVPETHPVAKNAGEALAAPPVF